MMIEENAVLRYRDDTGTVSAIVLQGSDPRPIRVGDFKGFVVHVDMHGRVEWPLPRL